MGRRRVFEHAAADAADAAAAPPPPPPADASAIYQAPPPAPGEATRPPAGAPRSWATALGCAAPSPSPSPPPGSDSGRSSSACGSACDYVSFARQSSASSVGGGSVVSAGGAQRRKRALELELFCDGLSPAQRMALRAADSSSGRSTLPAADDPLRDAPLPFVRVRQRR